MERRCVTSHRLRWLAPHSPRAPGGPRLSRSRYLVRGFIPARGGSWCLESGPTLLGFRPDLEPGHLEQEEPVQPRVGFVYRLVPRGHHTASRTPVGRPACRRPFSSDWLARVPAAWHRFFPVDHGLDRWPPTCRGALHPLPADVRFPLLVECDVSCWIGVELHPRLSCDLRGGSWSCPTASFAVLSRSVPACPRQRLGPRSSTAAARFDPRSTSESRGSRARATDGIAVAKRHDCLRTPARRGGPRTTYMRRNRCP